jgi:hypothetical protein
MFDIIIMDMGGHDANVSYLKQRLPHAHILKWTDHLSTIRRGTRHILTRYFWVLSSCCDYTDFDLLWEPTPWQSHQIHCWPSATQRFGDTFLIPTDEWRQQQASLTRLEDYCDVNFEHESVTRLAWQTVQYNSDSVVDAMRTSECKTPYVLFEHSSHTVTKQTDPWLWREQPVVALNANCSSSLVPRDAHSTVQDQIYDYQYLETQKLNACRPLDIVFISNGESNADDNWQFLNRVTANIPNRLVRVDGVQGRANSYRAALEASNTDWAFCVFAKLEVAANFDWSWQPDYWQQPKHYIFHARNPVNDLTYGHQAIIAYNKQLVMTNPAEGLDFTMEQPHEVVPVLSGVARYNHSAWTCWRTAFRECLKLRHSLPNVENEYRLRQWLTVGRGPKGEYSVWGAEDAMRYYDEVGGDFDALKKSYEWSWLASYALLTRNLEPDR